MATEAPASSQNEVSLLPRCLIIYHLGNREVERLMQRYVTSVLSSFSVATATNSCFKVSVTTCVHSRINYADYQFNLFQ